jgi:hypothetical protein
MTMDAFGVDREVISKDRGDKVRGGVAATAVGGGLAVGRIAENRQLAQLKAVQDQVKGTRIPQGEYGHRSGASAYDAAVDAGHRYRAAGRVKMRSRVAVAGGLGLGAAQGVKSATDRYRRVAKADRDRRARNGGIVAGTGAGALVAGGVAGEAAERKLRNRARQVYNRGTVLPADMKAARRLKLVHSGSRAAVIGGGTAAAGGLMYRESQRGKVRKADKRLPGDNPRAEAARGRRTAGLTGAGIGYLAASRTGDVAPGAADLLLPGGKNNTEARQAKVDALAGRMKRAGGKTGAVLVGGGLLAAGEGALSDLHHRDSYRRAVDMGRGKVRERVGKSSLDRELAKAAKKTYQPGSITLHQEQAAVHGRKKQAANRRFVAGVGAVAGSVAVGRAIGRVGPSAARMVVGTGKTGDQVYDRARIVRRFDTAGRRTGYGLMGGGTLVALQGTASSSYHGRRQDKENAAAQKARRARANMVSKAFDAERNRHARQPYYQGALAGGAVVAGAGSVAAGVGSHRARRGARAEGAAAAKNERMGMQALRYMGKPGGAKPTVRNLAAATDMLGAAANHRAAAGDLAGKSRRLARGSRASLLAGAALGAGSYGVGRADRRDKERYERRGGDRPYGY